MRHFRNIPLFKDKNMNIFNKNSVQQEKKEKRFRKPKVTAEPLVNQRW